MHSDEEAGTESSISGTGQAAHVPAAVNRPSDSDDLGVRVSKCGQEQLREQDYKGGRGRAAICFHHKEPVRGAYRLQVPQVAGGLIGLLRPT